jgi:hypothetical protein
MLEILKKLQKKKIRRASAPPGFQDSMFGFRLEMMMRGWQGNRKVINQWIKQRFGNFTLQG